MEQSTTPCVGPVQQCPAPPPPSYEPSLWNDGERIQKSTNCYAYAANDPYNHPPRSKPQPGQHSGTGMQDISSGELRRTSVADGMILAPDPPPPRPGYYVVAGVIAPDAPQDYHWYRQDNDGMWSHKPGWGSATNLDASGSLISDPKLADRNYSGTGGPNYSEFSGFFYVPNGGIRTGP